MKKLISIFLALLMSFSCLLALASCKNDEGTNDGGNGESNNQNPDSEGDGKPQFITPPYKDYGRGTVNFDELTYERPDTLNVLKSLSLAEKSVLSTELTYGEILENIKSAKKETQNFYSMFALAKINISKNMNHENYSLEFEYMQSQVEKVDQMYRNLLIACANSEFCEKFESDVFGKNVLYRFKNLKPLTDEALAIIDKEKQLIDSYKNLTPKTVKITTFGADGKEREDTVDNFLTEFELKYGKDSDLFFHKKTLIMGMFKDRIKSLTPEIFLELVKVRNSLAKAQGFESYIDIAYQNQNYLYSKEDMSKLLGQIKTAVVPTLNTLNEELFYNFFRENMENNVTIVELVNSLYNIYGKIDSDIQDIFAYMLQHKLFNIEKKSLSRNNVSFETFISSNNSPFIFVTSNEKISDSLQIAYEFGHFISSFKNGNGYISNDFREIASLSLELLTMLYFDGNTSVQNFTYLRNKTVSTALNILATQGLNATIEESIYRIDVNQISTDKINGVIGETFRAFSGSDYAPTLSEVISPSMITSPMHSHSNVFAETVALEIFFMEKEIAKSGLSIYKKIVDLENIPTSTTEFIKNAGLENPFADGVLSDICKKIYVFLTTK